jgi:hypothetical protein
MSIESCSVLTVLAPPYSFGFRTGSRAVLSWADYLIAAVALAGVFVVLYPGLVKF